MTAEVVRADPRIPAVGMTLEREFKGRIVKVTVRADGFEAEGQLHGSLTGAVRALTAQRDGYVFFGLGKLKEDGSIEAAVKPTARHSVADASPAEDLPPDGEWIQSGHIGYIVNLPTGSMFYADGIVKIGRPDEKGRLRLHRRKSRYPAREEDENVYGLGFYWTTSMPTSEELDRMERINRFGAHSPRNKELAE